ncbi:DUF305 domain-containing protein [Deinococcus sp. Arct2-2]|uniref:DUF305 domain-containing protein n=1 Tax=Deinococcus sp. Arct2-2 TaxID=2568653 RepID=UPI0010A38750|nr:DUF305 domain-containing protein [Deinococcus sp. Arct2-2]THF69218.1 DUF305 domain-containing protein [Deinococcus sp. Arct2-2]
MKRLPVIVISSVLSLGALAWAQGSMGGMDHSSMDGTSKAASASMPGMAMGSMDLSGLKKLSGKAFDRAFLSMMVPHHQAALDMARAVVPLSKDATVKAWANQIIRDQTREINTMNTLLKNYGGKDAPMAASMTKSMAGMGDMVKKAKNADVAFVQGMLPHHASAIEMANRALQQGTNDKVLALSRDIVTAQAKEMYSFRGWLTGRGL